MPLLPTTFLTAFLLTVFALQWWQLPTYPPFVWITLASIGTLSGIVVWMKRPYALPVYAGIAGVCCALLSVQHAITAPDALSIEQYAPAKHITILGEIVRPPDDRQTRIEYMLESNAIRLTETGAAIPVHGRVLLSDRRLYPRLHYGDTMEATGTFTLPESATFNYAAYLQMKGIGSILQVQGTTVLNTGGGSPLTRTLTWLRTSAEEKLTRIFPEPSASLLAGLLTGSRKGLPPALSETFRITGLTHILAISGFNITIIISIMTGALFFLPLRWRLIPSITMIVLFTLFVGAEASVVRAAIMGILGLLALHTGRMVHARLAVLWTAFFMLMWNPLQLWHDMGFHLSFLAVLGLMELSPILEPMLKNIPKQFGLRESLQTTLAAQLSAMPWSAASFGQLSLISPVANLLVAPLIPLAMLTGFISLCAGWISEPLGRMFGIPALVLLELMTDISTLLSHIPFASIGTGPIGVVGISIYYGLLVLCIWLLRTGRIPLIQKDRDLSTKARNTSLRNRSVARQTKGMTDDVRTGTQLTFKLRN